MANDVIVKPTVNNVVITPGSKNVTAIGAPTKVVIEPKANKVVITPVTNRLVVSTSGPQGIPGSNGLPGQPGAPGGSRFLHVQATPANVWSIVHNLGYTPHSTVRVAGEDITSGSDIFHVDLNNMTISFSAPLSGTVDLS